MKRRGCADFLRRGVGPETCPGAMLQSIEFISDSGALLERAARGLEKIVAQALDRAPAAESPLLAWPVACGSAVAERTRALSFADGILRVEVVDAGWQRELAALAPRYVAAVNRYSRTSVQRIEFIVKR